MIFCIQGRASEAPKPPQTKAQRRNFVVCIDSDHPRTAQEDAEKALEAIDCNFITVTRILEVRGETRDPALAKIVDEARRNGLGIAIYR